MAEDYDRGRIDNIIGPPGQNEENEVVVSARDRYERLSSEVQQRYERVSEDVRRGAERASQEIRRGSERAGERYREIAEDQRGYRGAHYQASNLANEASLYVRENPGKAILIAAGVGFLLGLIFRGGRPKK